MHILALRRLRLSFGGLTELQEMLLPMPSYKAPGCDGMTTEVLKAYWDFKKEDFLEMVCDFWRTGTLAYGIKDGVINFIPKKQINVDWVIGDL